MTVDFFLANEQNSPTVEFFLFSKELTSVIDGEYVEHNGQRYQVTGQLVADKPKMPHNAFVYPSHTLPVE